MASDLSTSEKAQKYDVAVAKAENAKVEKRVNTMRAVELATAGTAAAGNGAVLEIWPESENWLYGFAQPRVITMVIGVGLFFAAGKKRKYELVKEAGSGAFYGGALPLLEQGGRKIVKLVREATG